MDYGTARKKLAHILLFTPADLRKIEPQFRQPTLAEWKARGWVKMIAPGYYIDAEQELTESTLFSIANRLYSPSYISLESALSFYELIPEGVYRITSVSTRKTRTVASSLATFSFRSVTTSLFFGYRPVFHGQDQCCLIAQAEKALLDFLYLHPALLRREDFSGLRLDGDQARKLLNEKTLLSWSDRFPRGCMKERAEAIWSFLADA